VSPQTPTACSASTASMETLSGTTSAKGRTVSESSQPDARALATGRVSTSRSGELPYP
jgi:hypothetical protein